MSLPKNMGLYYCACGRPTLLPLGTTSYICWGCHKTSTWDPSRAHPVQYGQFRPRFPVVRYPSRVDPGPTRRPIPRNPIYRAPTPPPQMRPADFRMLEQPVGPILGDPPAPPAPVAAAPKAGLGFGGVVGIAISITIVVVAISALVNPEGFQDKVNDILSSVGVSSAGDLLSGSGSSNDSCAKVREAFSYIGDCSPSSRAGYQYCYVKTRSNSGCQTMNGVRLCDSGEGDAFIPNECVP